MEPATPITPLEPGVEMFTRGRPLSIVPVSSTDAQRLSIVPEVDTPSSKASLLDVPRASFQTRRPLSEVTEIYSDDEDARTIEQDAASDGTHESEFEEHMESDEEYEEEDDHSDDGSELEIMDALNAFQSRLNPSSLYVRSHSTPILQDEEWRQSGSSASTYNGVRTPMSNRRGPPLRVAVRESCEGPVGPHLFRASTTSSIDFSSFGQVLQMSPIQPKNLRSADAFYRSSQAIAQALDAIDTPTTTITEDPYTIPPLGWTWQSEDPATWTAQQVTIWMQESHIEGDIITCFAENDISGEILLKLELADLKELGIISFGKRHKVWNHICTLRDNQGHISKRNTITDEENTNRNSSHSKHSQSSCETPLVTAPRRRVKQNNMLNPITPADSVSIVAIEQLLPKPHICAKGANCPKYKKQQRMLEQLHKEHIFPISPGAGGRIVMAGNPGNAATAHNVVNHSRQHSQQTYDCRPTSEALPSVVGPSVVASSDLLGPGEYPALSLDPDTLEQVVHRDPQDNVMSFLALQQVEPPLFIPPSFDEDHYVDPSMQPSLRPTGTSAPRSALKALPRLQIPIENNILPFHHPADPTSAGPTMSAVDDYFSPELQAAPPMVARFGTPASEMDVPVTQPMTGPVARDTSQSVPPNMQFRDPVERSMSRVQDWRRPSMAMPALQEEDFPATGKVSHQAAAPLRPYRPSSVSSAPSDTVASPIFSTSNQTINSSNLNSVDAPSSKTSLDMLAANPGANGSMTSLVSSTGNLYKNITHSGWMKKRKTKLLRHEWHQHHFRLNGAQAQLTMHRNDLPSSSPLDTLNIDDYAVACSSIASNNKLAARFKALKIQKSALASSKDKDKDKEADAAAAFSFQLVPTKGSGSDVDAQSGKLLKRPGVSASTTALVGGIVPNGSAEPGASGSNSKKTTHHFAVKTRDDRIDWMRELMLAKALREKESSGHDVQVVRGEKEAIAAAAGVQ